MSRNSVELLARDGLRARDNGEWAEEKLDFISTFAPPAFIVTQGKRSRWYIDLFAGPGLNVIRGSRREIDGSPLRALEVHASTTSSLAFTDAIFVNSNQGDHAALGTRVERRRGEGRCVIPSGHVSCRNADANQEIHSIMSQVHKKAYAFVFVDIEAPRQFPWATVQALRSRGHESVDLYMLFHLDMALRRLLSTNPVTVAQSATVLNEFYGNENWRPLLETRRSEIGIGAQRLYLDQLRGLWTYADEVCDIRKGGSHRLYKMLYASDHPAGRRLAKWTAKHNGPPMFDFG
ncbi:hypothetical protein BH11GEM2_BH11GEM2_05660 [soil metagenome]